MKILFISPHSPDISSGGIERHVKNLIDYCCQNSIKAVFLMPALNNQDSRENIKDVLIIKSKFLNFNYKKFFDKKEISKEIIREKSRGFFMLLQQLIKEEKIGIINAQNFQSDLPPVYSFMLNMACFLENIPMVLKVHNFPVTEMQIALISDISWQKIFCVSKSVSGDCFNKGIEINKIHTQYLGVNTKEFKPNLGSHWLRSTLKIPESAQIILHASRIISLEKGSIKDILKEKGIITTMEAFAPIFLKDPNVRLVIAVATPPKDFIKEFRATLDKIRGYIQLHNILGGVILKEFRLEEMPLVYNGADIFVMASENETFGQVYIEAMACGIPVIGTNVGGIPEVITDNYNGFLIEPNNPSILTQKIEELLYNEKHRKEFILNGLKTVRRRFSAERQFSLLFSHFKKISFPETTSGNEILSPS